VTHLLGKPAAPQRPAAVVLLGVSYTEAASTVIGDRAKYSRVSTWAKTWLDADGEVLQNSTAVMPYVGYRLLEHIAAKAPPTGVTWVICDRMHRLMSSTGWYQALDAGEWDCGESSSPARLHAGDSSKKSFRGYLVVSDPPTLVLARSVEHNATLLLLDSRNWGWEQPDAAAPAQEQSRALTAWWRCYRIWVRDWLHGQLRSTAGATVMGGFRAGHMDSEVKIHSDPVARDMEQVAIFPGRCQCWRLGAVPGPVFDVDVRSAYPAIACERDFPCALEWCGHADKRQVAEWLRFGWGVIAQVGVTSDRGDYPYRDESGVYFPRGPFTTVLCGPELQIALDREEVRWVREVSVYKIAPVLRSFARAMLDSFSLLRTFDIPGLVGSAKFTTNCLWGRFAQRERRWKQCTCMLPASSYDAWCQDAPPPDHDCSSQEGVHYLARAPRTAPESACTRWRSIGWRVEYQTAPRLAADTFPAILAYLASYGRVQALRIIRTVGDHEMIYWDTDGGYVTERGVLNLESAELLGLDRPGKLRLVARSPMVTVYGCKHIEPVGAAPTHAGIPLHAERKGDRYVWRDVESVTTALSVHEAPTGRICRHRCQPGVYYPHGRLLPDGRVEPVTRFGGIEHGEGEE
jgi:hypothetical protein